MLISVVNRCTVKNVGAIPWKSDWQIYYCGEVNKFWLGVDEIEEAAIYEKSHSAVAALDKAKWHLIVSLFLWSSEHYVQGEVEGFWMGLR